jgi:hypothetical protein
MSDNFDLKMSPSKVPSNSPTIYEEPEGPIQQLRWGQFVINGQIHSKDEGVGKDIRMICLEVSAWMERPGHELRIESITGVNGFGIDTLIIGTGVNGMINVPQEVKDKILQSEIKSLVVEKTPDACRIFNEFTHQGIKVALNAHGTC